MRRKRGTGSLGACSLQRHISYQPHIHGAPADPLFNLTPGTLVLEAFDLTAPATGHK